MGVGVILLQPETITTHHCEEACDVRENSCAKCKSRMEARSYDADADEK